MTATELALLLETDKMKFNMHRLALEQAIEGARRAHAAMFATLYDGGAGLANALQEAAER